MKTAIYAACVSLPAMMLLYPDASFAAAEKQQGRKSQEQQLSDEANVPGQTSYDREISELRSRMEAEIRQLKAAAEADRARADEIRRYRQQEELGYVPSEEGVSVAETDRGGSGATEEEKAIRQRYERAIEQVRKRKATAAAIAEKRPMQAQSTMRASTTAMSRRVVTGIVHCDESAAALVDGDIIHEGDTIDGVKVIAITLDAVEFEKGGVKWRQRVGQSPGQQWSEQQATVHSPSEQPDANQHPVVPPSSQR